jgi:hypothetical protein
VGKSNRAAAAAHAAQLRAEAAQQQRQRKQVMAAGIAVLVVVVAVVAATLIANRPKDQAPVTGGAAALAKLVALPASTLDQAAAPQASQAPAKLTGGTALTDGGKPKVLYIGAEYCPFCALERWALIGAMARFGTFSGLTETTSSSSDVHPNTPTFSFHGATYSSDVLAFEAVETQDREGKPLDTLDGENAALFAKYNPQGGIPWISFGGTHAIDGATVDADLFEGKTYDQIIAGILDPTSEIGRSLDPAINAITAQICAETNNKPANVCTSKAVQSASAVLQR